MKNKNKKEQLPKELEFSESNFDFETREYKKGMMVFEEGSKPAGLFYVKKGTLNIYRKDKTGNDVLLRNVKEGQFSGYNDLMNNREYTKSATAREDCVLYFIAKKDFLKLMNSNDIVKYFFRLTSIDLQISEEALINGAGDELIEGKYSNIEKEEARLNITMPELVNFLGSTVESFIKVLSDLNNRNVISLRSNMLTMPEANRIDMIKHLQKQLLINTQN